MSNHIRIKLNGKEMEPLRKTGEQVPYEIEWVSGKREAEAEVPDTDFTEVWKLADWLMIE